MSDHEIPYGTYFPQPPIQFGGIDLLKAGSAVMVGRFRESTANDPEVKFFASAEAALAELQPSVQSTIQVPVWAPLAHGGITTKQIPLTRTLGETAGSVAEQFGDAAHVLGCRTGDGKEVAAHPLFDLRVRASVARALLSWLERSHRELLDPETRSAVLADVRQKLGELVLAYPATLPTTPAKKDN